MAADDGKPEIRNNSGGKTNVGFQGDVIHGDVSFSDGKFTISHPDGSTTSGPAPILSTAASRSAGSSGRRIPYQVGGKSYNADGTEMLDGGDDGRENPEASSSSHETPGMQALQEERERARGAENLRNQENTAGAAGGGSTTPNPKDSNGNIEKAKESEQAGGPWKTEYTGGKQKVVGKAFLKRKGPTGVIITVVTGGGLGIAGLISPAGALIHVKEIIQEKFDTMASVVEERSILHMRSRIFSTVDTNATCKIKVRCRYKGLTEEEMKSLRQSGADVLDANGKPLTKSKLTGRYTGGKTLVVPHIDGSKEKIEAKAYASAVRSNPSVKSAVKSVWSSAYGVLQKSKASLSFRSEKKLTTNPDVGDGSDKDPEQAARKKIYSMESGEQVSAETVPPDAKDYTTDKNGNKKLNGDQVPNLDNLSSGLNDAADKVNQDLADGKIVDPIPSDIAGAAAMDVSPISSGFFSKALGFLNPASIVVGMCTTYKLANAAVMISRTYLLANAMRYAAIFLAAADKVKAGDGDSNLVNQLMTILERVDPYGDAFGDSVGYQWAAYGAVPDKDIASSATGNAVIHALALSVAWINHTLGKKNVKTGCKILTNPVTQGVLSLTSFIPGGGAIFAGLKTVLTVGAKKEVESTITKSIQKMIAKTVKDKLSKDALKSVGKAAGKEILKMAGGALGIFVAGYLLERYFVPYMTHLNLNGSEDGVLSMDTIANGRDATNQGTGLDYGMQPLKKGQAATFEQFDQNYKNSYAADMRAQSNPFDILDPYSASNSLASTLFTFSSKLKNGNILSAPATILSAINPTHLLGSTAHAADNSSGCDDEYLNEKNLATTPFCNVIVGYSNIDKLENVTPEQNVDWMLAQNQIDENGDPVPDSDYAKFQDECGTNAGSKIITEFDPGEDTGTEIMPEDCYSSKTDTDEWQNFYLYNIDTSTGDAMDAKPVDTNTSNVKYIAVGNIPVTGKDVGASVFGGKQVSGGLWAANWADNGGNDNGNSQSTDGTKQSKCNTNSPHLTGTVSFAELDMGKALGDIPDCTKLEIKFKDSGKTIVATKQDIGAGGGDVNGHKRAVDLWWEAANALGFNVGTGVVTIHAVDPSTPETSTTTSAFKPSKSSKNVGSLFNNITKIGDFSIFSPSSIGTR